MSQKSLIAGLSILALFLGGCPSGEDSETVVQSTPVPIPKKVPQKPKLVPTPFATPLTAQKPGKSTAVAGLIQSPPPDARLNQARKNLGRNDPFAAIPTQPVAILPSPGAAGGTANRPVPVIPQLPPTRGNAGGAGVAGGTGRAGRAGGTGATGRAGATGRTNVLPQRPTTKPPTAPIAKAPTTRTPIITNRPGTPGGAAGNNPGGPLPLPPLAVGPRELPQLQEPTLAQSVEITGVVEAGGIQSAIVKLPNEPARSVRAGERLLNGQVLVKRIEVNSGPTPTVILEQFGQEVARQVGDKPSGTPGQPGSPTALLEKTPKA